MVSCTTVKRDDHSYSYVYQHNEKNPNDSDNIPKPRKNVEYTTYKQEYNNFKTTDSDAEYLENANNTVPSFFGNDNNRPTQYSKPSKRKDFNPFDNQFINSNYRGNKNREERVPDIFGPEGYVKVETGVPNSNPPIINTYYYPASNFR